MIELKEKVFPPLLWVGKLTQNFFFLFSVKGKIYLLRIYIADILFQLLCISFNYVRI